MRDFSEQDMYEPVKRHFEALGYTMRGEVMGIDAAAEKDGELILFEFKKAFNVKLLYQALDRQQISRQVYIVIPKPGKRGGEASKIRVIAKALGLGLITVDMNARISSFDRAAEIILEPAEPRKPLDNIRTRRVKREIAGRKLDGNKAGSVNTKLLTAYRERCIKIACTLYKHGEMTPKQLREKGCPPDTSSILRQNYYGWFYAAQKGVYFLTDAGFNEIENGTFKEAVELYYSEE